MPKWLKYILLSFLGVVLLLFISTAAITLLYQKDLKDQLLSRLNSNLMTPITIEGDIDVSAFRYFPDVAVRIEGFRMAQSLPDSIAPLIKAEKTDLILSLWDVLSQNWRIKTIAIQNGSFHMLRRADGVINFQFTIPSPPGTVQDTSSPDIFLNITKASLENIHYTYLDERSQLLIDLLVEDGTLSGNFSAQSLFIEASGDVFSNSLRLGEIDYLPKKKTALQGQIAIRPDEELYDIVCKSLIVEDNHFALDGTIRNDPKFTDFDLKVQGKELSLNGFYALLPTNIQQANTSVKMAGKLNFDATFKGPLGEGKQPRIDIEYRLEKASLRDKAMKAEAKDLSVHGTFTTGKSQNLTTSMLTLKDLKATVNGQPLAAWISIDDFNYPFLNVEGKGVIDLALLNAFLPANTRLQGRLTISYLHYKGRAADLIQTKKIPEIEGDVTFSGFQLSTDSTYFRIPKGRLSMKKDVLTAQDLQIQTPYLSAHIEGKADNLHSYLLYANTGRLHRWKPLTLEAVISIDSLALEPFLDGESDDNTGGSASLLPFLSLKGKVDLQASRITYHRFVASNLQGTLEMSPGEFDFSKVSLHTMDGKLTLNSQMLFTEGRTNTQTEAKAEGISIQQLFYQLNNFDQNVLRHDHLSGSLNASMQLNLPFRNGEVYQDSITATASLQVDNGALVHFEPLQQLSKYVDIAELRDIRFSRLENQIAISNRRIYIPQMLIRTSALTLALSGEHSFDNEIDYKIKVDVFNVLGRKLKKKKAQDKNYEFADDDSFNFFLSMTGTVDDPIFKYDRQGITDRFKKQKKEIQKAFNKTQDSYNEQKEARDWQTDEELEFIEWDEEKPEE